MRGVAIIIAMQVAACGFSAEVKPLDVAIDAADETSVDASSTSSPDAGKPPDFHLRIEAMIDGESYLHIKGTMVWWENRIFAAPGRWDADGAAPWDVRPITFNGTQWLPTWPDVPSSENRDCMCLSSKTQLAVGVPQVPSTTTWKEVQVRRAQGIIQYPMASNGWELIVLISDYMVGGAAPYIVEVDSKVN